MTHNVMTHSVMTHSVRMGVQTGAEARTRAVTVKTLVKTLLIATVCATLVTASPAAGGAATGGATEWTQLLNNVQLVDIVGIEGQNLAKNAQILTAELNQLRTQINTYQTILRNTARLPDQLFAASHGTLEQVARDCRRGAGTGQGRGVSGPVFAL